MRSIFIQRLAAVTILASLLAANVETIRAQGLKRPGKRPSPQQDRVLLNVSAQLGPNDRFDTLMQNSYCKVYTVEMMPGNTYVIDHMSGNFDCYLRLEDANGNRLRADDDGGNGLNSRIVFSPPAQGKYRVIATTLGARQVGQFTLTVQTKQVLFTTSGQLSREDPTDLVRQGCHFRLFKIRMEKGKTYTIDLQGNYDPYLRIEDALGNQRGQDDDGGGNLNARLIFRPEETDFYRIIVTSCSSGRVGNYTLSISD